MPLCRKKFDVWFLERLENSEKVHEFWSSLGGPHFGSERSDSIREMHFWTFSVFLCFQTWGGYVDLKTFFDTSRAQLRQGKPAQVKLGRVERHRPAGLIHTNTRSPACGSFLLVCTPQKKDHTCKTDSTKSKLHPSNGQHFWRTTSLPKALFQTNLT